MLINNNILFVYGSDDFLVDRRARILYDEYCKHGEIFSFDSKANLNTFINSICESLNTLPLFTSTNNIWIRGIKFLSDGESESTKTIIYCLLEALKFARNNSIILISASPIDKRTKLFKEISQLSDCQEVNDINEKTIDAFINNICTDNKVKITAAAVEAIQRLIGNDSRLLKLELDKLATYIFDDHDTITVDDVNMLVEASNGGEFFQQIEQFYSSDINKILDSLARYFYFTNEARPLLAGLQNRTRLMIQLRALVESNKLQLNKAITKLQLDTVAKILNFDTSFKTSYNVFTQNSWYLSKLLDSIGKYSLNKLLDLQVAIMDTIAETAIKYDDQISVMQKLALKF